MRTAVALLVVAAILAAQSRPRAREAGIVTGTLPTGAWNAITDVPGVAVGHATLVREPSICTGVTAILPHAGNLFREKVPAAIYVFNAFGKLAGYTQVAELGEIEAPILLTSTLNVPRVADAVISYVLALPGNGEVRSINPVVGETNDSRLNDIRSRPLGREEVLSALRSAKPGPVDEGAVGAGAGTIALGFKAGIGTSSRRVGAYTVGVLVQSNFGGTLTIAGIPVGRQLRADAADARGGSIMIVVATDAPAGARNLKRLAARSFFGLARTGASGSNGSGDYAIAFSTSRRPAARLGNDQMSPLFIAVAEATEEAVYNSLFRAATVTSNGRTVEALPLGRVLEILRYHKIVR